MPEPTPMSEEPAVAAEDLILPPDICPPRGAAADAWTADAEGPVLVTGATGFLGSVLTAELLATTSGEVWCLARSGRGVSAGDRVRSALAGHGLWDPAWEPRLRVLEGDLRRRRGGLSDADHDDVVRRVVTYFHCGARVNFLASYRRLRASNVLGTVELLRMAGAGRTSRFAYCSTISTLYSASLADAVVPDGAAPGPLEEIDFGYAQSKWVAESLVGQAVARGLDAVVFRPGLLSGHSAHLVSNPLEWNWLLIKTIARLGRAPVMRFPLDWSPVDAVARAIVHLTGATGGSTGPYHLVTPSLLTHAQVYAWMADFGLAAETVEYEDWLALAARAAPTLPTELRAFVLSLPDAEESAATPYPPRYQSDRTHQLLANAGLTYPPVDQELFTRYLALGVERGELPGPGTAVHAPRVTSRAET